MSWYLLYLLNKLSYMEPCTLNLGGFTQTTSTPVGKALVPCTQLGVLSPFSQNK